MATNTAPPSLQRTNSSGHFHIYILIENKIDKNLLIISRDHLPPTLRAGKLSINQKITFRTEKRHNIEGVIVYMSHNQEDCVTMKNNLLQQRNQQQKENIPNQSGHLVAGEYDCQTVVVSKPSKSTTKKTSQLERKTKPDQTNKCSTRTLSTSSTNDLADEDINDSIEYSLSSITTPPEEQETINTSSHHSCETSTRVVDTNQDEIYLDKINELSTTVAKQAKIIKRQNDELKRLRQTTIEIPTDPEAQKYLILMGDKVRQNTTAFLYQGNLSNDAKRLGLKVPELNKILNIKGGITTIARELFKSIVPEDRRRVQLWNEIGQDVLVKEKLLIDFMTRYYGPLQADEKKIHVSLLGCLRNQRNTEKKQGQASSMHNRDHEPNDREDLHLSDDLEGLHD